MNDLEINKNTTLYLPDSSGDIEIDMWAEESGNNSAYVSFEKLEKWVASIREQIITVAPVDLTRVEEMLENKDICSDCGGECCKVMPGSCYPSDFGLPGDFSMLDKALKSGKYCIDWWDGDPREGETDFKDDECYFVRPATKDKIGVKYDPSWGGECVFLTEIGCELESVKRPLNCKKLEPVKNGRCILHDNTGKQDAAIAWLPYSKKLKRS